MYNQHIKELQFLILPEQPTPTTDYELYAIRNVNAVIIGKKKFTNAH